MKSFRLGILGALTLTFGVLASAQASRTWVSGVGDDANPCSRTAPCKTFAGAISKTAPAGEIDCLDPGGFGNVTITKAMTIDCDAGVGGASVLAGAGTDGIVIAAATTDVVHLRNLGVMGLGTALTGIKIQSALSVHLESVVVYQLATACVVVDTTSNSQLTIHDSTFQNCGNSGLRINTTSGNTVVCDFHNLRIFNAGNGINAQNGSRISVRDSEIAFANPGINQSNLSGGGAVVMVQGSALTSNGTAALQSAAGGQITACGNTFSANALMFNTAGGTITSCGDNNHMPSDPQGSVPGPAPKV